MLLRLSTTVKSNERGCQRKGSHPAILIVTVPTQFQPMPLLKRAAPLDDPEWIFELKYDGFRALAIIEHGRAQLLSRNGHPFASFAELGKQIAVACQTQEPSLTEKFVPWIDVADRSSKI